MQYVFTKTSHQFHELNGKHLESKSYLPHDLMHVSFAQVTSSREGFFADQTNEAREEQVVGMLQGAFKEYAKDRVTYSFDALSQRIDHALGMFGHPTLRLPASVLAEVFRVYEQWRVKWENMRTGETLVVEV